MLLWQPREHGSVLEVHRLQAQGIDTQTVQDGGRYLRSGYRRFHNSWRKGWIRNDQPHIRIAEAESTVLSVLLG